jgi:hypothetical protein
MIVNILKLSVMVNEKLKMKPDWVKTLDSLKVGEVCQFEVEGEKVENVTSAITRFKKKSNKNFSTRSLLGGGFEIKRTK